MWNKTLLSKDNFKTKLSPFLEEILLYLYGTNKSSATQRTSMHHILQFLKFAKIRKARKKGFLAKGAYKDNTMTIQKLITEISNSKEAEKVLDKFKTRIDKTSVKNIDLAFVISIRNEKLYKPQYPTTISLYNTYLTTLIAKKLISETTAKHRLIAVRTLFRKLMEYGKIKDNLDYLKSIKQIKAKNKAKDDDVLEYLTKDQADALIKMPLKEKGVSNQIRDSLIIQTFLHLGLRLTELIWIDFKDFFLTKDGEGNDIYYLKILGKGNSGNVHWRKNKTTTIDESRRVYVSKALMDLIELYKTTERKNTIELAKEQAERSHKKKMIKDHKSQKTPFHFKIDEDALFLNRYAQRIKQTSIQDMVKHYLKLTAKELNFDYEPFHVHSLRHSSSSIAFESGVDILTLQAFLGHNDLNSTLVYTHINKRKLMDMARNSAFEEQSNAAIDRVMQLMDKTNERLNPASSVPPTQQVPQDSSSEDDTDDYCFDLLFE